jgi:hypothetical protein
MKMIKHNFNGLIVSGNELIFYLFRGLDLGGLGGL